MTIDQNQVHDNDEPAKAHESKNIEGFNPQDIAEILKKRTKEIIDKVSESSEPIGTRLESIMHEALKATRESLEEWKAHQSKIFSEQAQASKKPDTVEEAEVTEDAEVVETVETAESAKTAENTEVETVVPTKDTADAPVNQESADDPIAKQQHAQAHIAKKEASNHVCPIGNLLLRTMALPRDTNPAGDIFGGWIMSQMDIAGAVLAREIAQGRVVTVAVDAMNFLKPVGVGDIVCCYGHCVHVGKSSLRINLELWVKKIYDTEVAQRSLVTEASFTYVAVDSEGHPRPLPADAKEIAEKGIDAGTAGLYPDGSINKSSCPLNI